MLLNLPRLQKYLERAGLDAVIAASPVNVTYLTDWTLWLDRSFKEYMVKPGGADDLIRNYALVTGAGEATLFVEPILAVNAADGWVKDVRAPADLLAVIRERGLQRVGIEPVAPAWLRRELPGVEFRECANLLRLVRMVKSTEEVSRLEQAATIADSAARRCVAAAKPGMLAQDLARMFRELIAREGADLDHFAFGMNGRGIATEPAYRLRAGEALYFDFGCVYRQYCSDSGFTLTLGELEPDLRWKHDALREAVEAGRAVMRPGVKASAIPAAMWAALHARGIKDGETYPHGHGLGLEVRDYPILVADTGLRVQDECVNEPADLRLEAGMVLNLESAIFLPDRASLHCERSFLVEATGARPLLKSPSS